MIAKAARKLTSSGVARDTSFVAGGQILFKGMLYLVSIGLSRTLTVEQFAAFGYFTVTSRLLSVFIAAGLTIAATKAFTDAASREGDDGRSTEAVAFLLVASSLLGFVAAPAYLPIFADDKIEMDSWWLVVGAISQSLFAVSLAAMFGARAFGKLLIPLAIGSAFLLAGGIITALSGDIVPVLAGFCISFLTPALLYGKALASTGLVRRRLPSLDHVLITLRTSLPTLATGLINVGIIWLITKTLLDHASSAVEFNKYLIGIQWFALVLFIPNALGNALFPRFIQDANSGQFNLRLSIVTSSSVLAVLTGVAVVGTLATPFLSYLYGVHYEFSYAFVLVTLVGSALAGAVSMLSFPVMANLGVGSWLRVNLVLFGVSIALLALRPPSSALDAALIVAAGQVTALMLAWILLWRHSLKLRSATA